MNKNQNNKVQFQKIKVMVIEDHRPICDSLMDIINGTEGLECTGAFNSVEDALIQVEKNLPDVMLMDIGLPGMSGIEGIILIKSRYPSVDILMHTVYDDDEKIFQSICNGASGYVLKNAETAELINAINEVKTGAPMSASIARRLLNVIRTKENIKSGKLNLTAREFDIVKCLVDGLSYKGIAEKLFISPLTVQSHIKHIYEKLHVHSKSAVVSKVLRFNLFR
ncbi:MAG TPA: response regulator transcription factor [Ignavibacteriaceae bacterium]|nr:response regulator transcription factor [Ignavibacteriaceae bacterium]